MRKSSRSAEQQSGTFQKEFDNLRVTKFDILRLLETSKSTQDIIKFLAGHLATKPQVDKIRTVNNDHYMHRQRVQQNQDQSQRILELQQKKREKQEYVRELKSQLKQQRNQDQILRMQSTPDQNQLLNTYRGFNIVDNECKNALKSLADLKSVIDELKPKNNGMAAEQNQSQANKSKLMFEQKLQIAKDKTKDCLEKLSNSTNQNKLIQKFEQINIRDILKVSELIDESKDYILQRLNSKISQLSEDSQNASTKMTQDLSILTQSSKIEEVQRVFSDTQATYIKIQKVKEQCEKSNYQSLNPEVKNQLAFEQEQSTLGYLQQILEQHELTNQDLNLQLEHFRDIVNIKVTPDFIKDKDESLRRQRKFIQAYMTIALKFKQRTDGFVAQNFAKLGQNELPLLQTISQSYIGYLQKLNENMQNPKQTMKILNIMFRKQVIRDMCLDQTELANTFLRGTFNPTRLSHDQTLINLNLIVCNGQIERDIRGFINSLRSKLINLVVLENEDKNGQGKRLRDRDDRLKNLLKEIKSYNQVFLPNHEKQMNNMVVKLKCILNQVNPHSFKLYVQDKRQQNIRYQNSISFIKDSGIQYKDFKTGMIKHDQGKSVGEYQQMIFTQNQVY
ncbi:UNKNOWN [Stylonychia lemnae]|uniref:Uncharacterized protein n=1 Tax=Stylonychia lemnae TaxID=5949 RepID=A0A078AUX6_STYLE|nr:UNKNOWN [Stylonychia lemnae]|eukprot:CDW85052.1 UNKNOWN [Stylonychia lemnae]